MEICIYKLPFHAPPWLSAEGPMTSKHLSNCCICADMHLEGEVLGWKGGPPQYHHCAMQDTL